MSAALYNYVSAQGGLLAYFGRRPISMVGAPLAWYEANDTTGVWGFDTGTGMPTYGAVGPETASGCDGGIGTGSNTAGDYTFAMNASDGDIRSAPDIGQSGIKTATVAFRILDDFTGSIIRVLSAGTVWGTPGLILSITGDGHIRLIDASVAPVPAAVRESTGTPFAGFTTGAVYVLTVVMPTTSLNDAVVYLNGTSVPMGTYGTPTTGMDATGQLELFSMFGTPPGPVRAAVNAVVFSSIAYTGAQALATYTAAGTYTPPATSPAYDYAAARGLYHFYGKGSLGAGSWLDTPGATSAADMAPTVGVGGTQTLEAATWSAQDPDNKDVVFTSDGLYPDGAGRLTSATSAAGSYTLVFTMPPLDQYDVLYLLRDPSSGRAWAMRVMPGGQFQVGMYDAGAGGGSSGSGGSGGGSGETCFFNFTQPAEGDLVCLTISATPGNEGFWIGTDTAVFLNGVAGVPAFTPDPQYVTLYGATTDVFAISPGSTPPPWTLRMHNFVIATQAWTLSDNAGMYALYDSPSTGGGPDPDVVIIGGAGTGDELAVRAQAGSSADGAPPTVNPAPENPVRIAGAAPAVTGWQYARNQPQVLYPVIIGGPDDNDSDGIADQLASRAPVLLGDPAEIRAPQNTLIGTSVAIVAGIAAAAPAATWRTRVGVGVASPVSATDDNVAVATMYERTRLYGREPVAVAAPLFDWSVLAAQGANRYYGGAFGASESWSTPEGQSASGVDGVHDLLGVGFDIATAGASNISGTTWSMTPMIGWDGRSPLPSGTTVPRFATFEGAANGDLATRADIPASTRTFAWAFQEGFPINGQSQQLADIGGDGSSGTPGYITLHSYYWGPGGGSPALYWVRIAGIDYVPPSQTIVNVSLSRANHSVVVVRDTSGNAGGGHVKVYVDGHEWVEGNVSNTFPYYSASAHSATAWDPTQYSNPLSNPTPDVCPVAPGLNAMLVYATYDVAWTSAQAVEFDQLTGYTAPVLFNRASSGMIDANIATCTASLKGNTGVITSAEFAERFPTRYISGTATAYLAADAAKTEPLVLDNTVFLSGMAPATQGWRYAYEEPQVLDLSPRYITGYAVRMTQALGVLDSDADRLAVAHATLLGGVIVPVFVPDYLDMDVQDAATGRAEFLGQVQVIDYSIGTVMGDIAIATADNGGVVKIGTFIEGVAQLAPSTSGTILSRPPTVDVNGVATLTATLTGDVSTDTFVGGRPDTEATLTAILTGDIDVISYVNGEAVRTADLGGRVQVIDFRIMGTAETPSMLLGDVVADARIRGIAYGTSSALGEVKAGHFVQGVAQRAPEAYGGLTMAVRIRGTAALHRTAGGAVLRSTELARDYEVAVGRLSVVGTVKVPPTELLGTDERTGDGFRPMLPLIVRSVACQNAGEAAAAVQGRRGEAVVVPADFVPGDDAWASARASDVAVMQAGGGWAFRRPEPSETLWLVPLGENGTPSDGGLYRWDGRRWQPWESAFERTISDMRVFESLDGVGFYRFMARLIGALGSRHAADAKDLLQSGNAARAPRSFLPSLTAAYVVEAGEDPRLTAAAMQSATAAKGTSACIEEAARSLGYRAHVYGVGINTTDTTPWEAFDDAPPEEQGMLEDLGAQNDLPAGPKTLQWQILDLTAMPPADVRPLRQVYVDLRDARDNVLQISRSELQEAGARVWRACAHLMPIGTTLRFVESGLTVGDTGYDVVAARLARPE